MATTEERLTSLEQQVSTVATKVDMMILESQTATRRYSSGARKTRCRY